MENLTNLEENLVLIALHQAKEYLKTHQSIMKEYPVMIDNIISKLEKQ